MLKGNVALISGGSRGIGRAIALTYAKNGADIAVLYAGNEKAAAETCALAREHGIKAIHKQCDVSIYPTVQSAMKEIVSELGPVSILVNNAGITRDKLAVQMKPDDFSDVVATNLNGAFHLIQTAYSGFIRLRRGRIINISSVAGLMGNAGQANYAASKAGLIGLTKSIAKELAPRSVTCNAIAPGLIMTDMAQAMNETARSVLIDAVPLKRMGTAEDVAALALFLASEHAAYITGAVIPVDGGLSM
ncbi:3-oxoacyl-[acyl-carrier-protein] reductase [Christensenellaceae bacterium OttesenSCG-928-M15]|nr:3-oxoacyl-[acyl-carrier-protein] reductase [Christensenellaceae bacterium OttesenSCG-928-M15]